MVAFLDFFQWIFSKFSRGHSSKKQVSRKHSSSSSKSNGEEIPNAAYNCIDLHDAETVSIEATYVKDSRESAKTLKNNLE